MKALKQPQSVLVVIHTADLQVLLIERADKPGYWQSVTGSREGDEAMADTARREVAEETGFAADAGQWQDWQQQNVYEIYPHWRHRYGCRGIRQPNGCFRRPMPRPSAPCLYELFKESRY